jgi:hypothetical protein
MNRNLSAYFPKPHPTKAIFRTRGIPNCAVAKFLGLSTNYISSVLNGAIRATAENERKLFDFAKIVENETSAGLGQID